MRLSIFIPSFVRSLIRLFAFLTRFSTVSWCVHYIPFFPSLSFPLLFRFLRILFLSACRGSKISHIVSAFWFVRRYLISECKNVNGLIAECLVNVGGQCRNRSTTRNTDHSCRSPRDFSHSPNTSAYQSVSRETGQFSVNFSLLLLHSSFLPFSLLSISALFCRTFPWVVSVLHLSALLLLLIIC